MNRFFLALAVCGLSFGLLVGDAEAKRFGGGRSMGIQRQATPPPQKAAPAPASAAAPAAAAPKRSWMGPLAGLAAGLGIAALLSHFGLGEEMASLVMILLLAMAAFFVFRLFFRRQSTASPSAAALRYAGATDNPGAQPAGQGSDSSQHPLRNPGGAAALPPSPATTVGAGQAGIPAGFDVDGFLRVAKLNFVRLQAANDAGNMEDIREFVSPEVFAEIRLQLAERPHGGQQTDVVTVDADLLDIATEGSRHIASVRLHGMIREEAEAAALPFDEVWHLTKPVDGSSGWVVAGIQQLS